MALADTDSFSSCNESSNAPNRFFRRHHEVEAPEISERAFRPAWRIRTKLDRLAMEGAITGFEYRVATWLQSCYERGFGTDLRSSMPRLGMAGHSSTRGREDPASRRAAARDYLHHIEQALGPVVYPIILAVVVDELPWAKLGQRYGCHAKTARVWAVEALKALPAV